MPRSMNLIGRLNVLTHTYSKDVEVWFLLFSLRRRTKTPPSSLPPSPKFSLEVSLSPLLSWVEFSNQDAIRHHVYPFAVDRGP